MKRSAAFKVVLAVVSLSVVPAYGLDTSKGPAGANHAAAHATATGAGIGIGVLEVPEIFSTVNNPSLAQKQATSGINLAKYHFAGRLQKDRWFMGLSPMLAADPTLATGASDHGTLVSDVTASSDAVNTGVANGADVYAGWIDTYDGARAAVDWYNRAYSIGVFNHSYTFGLNDNGANQFARFFDWTASNKDILHVVAAGNNGGTAGGSNNQLGQPADQMNGITVGAVDHNFRKRAYYSSYWVNADTGAIPDIRAQPMIVAPGGEQVNGDGISNGIIDLQGTSFAAPHVAGTVALLAQKGLPLGNAFNHNHLAQKAIILNSARKRFINGPRNQANAFAEDYQGAVAGVPTSAGQASDADYLNGAVLRPGSTAVSPKTEQWTPTQWNYTAGGVFSTNRPLDDETGVGVLDADRALYQQAAGQQNGKVKIVGWDIGFMSGGFPNVRYEIDANLNAGDFITTTLVWDQIINSSDNDQEIETTDTYSFSALPDFDLNIYRKTAAGLLLVAESAAIGTSVGSNLEHLHIPVPTAGNYVIEVKNTAQASAFYGLAWWTVPEPTSLLTMSVIWSAMASRRRIA